MNGLFLKHQNNNYGSNSSLVDLSKSLHVVDVIPHVLFPHVRL